MSAVKHFGLIVCGGRDYRDRSKVFATLDAILDEKRALCIIHGACCVKGKPTELRGADRWAQEWAQTNEQPYMGFPAQWDSFGNAAGSYRNRLMASIGPDAVVAFHGGAGTASMMSLARAAGIPVWEIEP